MGTSPHAADGLSRPRRSVAGRRERLAAVRSALIQADVTAMVCALPTNVLLLTGYWPVVGTACAVVWRDGTSQLIVPKDEAASVRSWSDDVRTFPTRPSTADAHIEMLADLLKDTKHRLPVERIAVEQGPSLEPTSYVGMYLYGSSLAEAARKAWPGAAIVSAEPLLTRLRAAKTAADIMRIRTACRVVEGALRCAATQIQAGRSERAIAAYVRSAMSIGAPVGAVRADGFAFCMSGANAARASGAFARSSAKRLEPGDLVLIHCNSFVDGYWTDITRTYCLGRPTRRIRNMYAAVFSARAAALKAIRPGARAQDVDRAAREVLENRSFGSAFKHSTGHGVGFAAIDPNARPRLEPTSEDVLTPGMVCNVEPAIYIDGLGGIRHCDMVAVTAYGASLLTPFQATPEELVLV